MKLLEWLFPYLPGVISKKSGEPELHAPASWYVLEMVGVLTLVAGGALLLANCLAKTWLPFWMLAAVYAALVVVTVQRNVMSRLAIKLQGQLTGMAKDIVADNEKLVQVAYAAEVVRMQIARGMPPDTRPLTKAIEALGPQRIPHANERPDRPPLVN